MHLDAAILQFNEAIGAAKTKVLEPKDAKEQHKALRDFCAAAKNIAHFHACMKRDLGRWRDNVFSNSDDGRDSVAEDIETVLIEMDNLYRRPKPDEPNEFVVV